MGGKGEMLFLDEPVEEAGRRVAKKYSSLEIGGS